MNRNHFWQPVLAFGVATFILCGGGCSQADHGTSEGDSPRTQSVSAESTKLAVPAELAEGEAKFNTFCARCHGAYARGTQSGPPLVHKIYEPNHHGDFAFQRAAANGVRAHHWSFGNMPRITGVSSGDVREIIAYVRWLQREAGIF